MKSLHLSDLHPPFEPQKPTPVRFAPTLKKPASTGILAVEGGHGGHGGRPPAIPLFDSKRKKSLRRNNSLGARAKPTMPTIPTPWMHNASDCQAAMGGVSK